MLVAFDLDGTLVDQAGAARRWARELVETWRLPDAAADPIAARLIERRPKGPLFDDLVSAWRLPVTGGALADSYRRRMPQLVRCTDEDRTALATLRTHGWLVGIVTNGSVQNQEGKIRATGLGDLVDGWVISEAVGVRKPEPGIFRALADRLSCELRGWMVGDGLEHDVAGAAAVGLSTVWIDPAGAAPEGAAAPTLVAPTAAAAVTPPPCTIAPGRRRGSGRVVR